MFGGGPRVLAGEVGGVSSACGCACAESAGVMRSAEELETLVAANPRVLELLRDTIGLRSPDVNDALHAELLDTLFDLGPGASLGERVVAVDFVFGWHHREAGKRFAAAKTDYEAHIAKTKTRLLAEPKMSVAKADVIAEADDESYRLKLQYLLAEQEERALRKFRETLGRALDNHRTDRADRRAQDSAHAQGYTGGA